MRDARPTAALAGHRKRYYLRSGSLVSVMQTNQIGYMDKTNWDIFDIPLKPPRKAFGLYADCFPLSSASPAFWKKLEQCIFYHQES